MSFRSTQDVGHWAKTGVAKSRDRSHRHYGGHEDGSYPSHPSLSFLQSHPMQQVLLYLTTDTIRTSIFLYVSGCGSRSAREGPESVNGLNPSQRCPRETARAARPLTSQAV